MKNAYKIVLGFAVIFILSAGLLSFWWEDKTQEMYDDSFQSSYVYDITLTADSTLNNVTLYVPVPVVNNTSAVGQDILAHNFNKDDPSWEYALVDTEHGLMLSMSTEKLVPGYRPLPVPISEDSAPYQESEPVASDKYSNETPVLKSISFSTMVSADHIIDTKNPLDNEMLLLPKYDLNSSQNMHNYESQIYAEYESSPDARAEISVSMTGCNEWWIGGWQSNSYSEWMNIVLSGPQGGWVPVEISLVTGEGVYKD